MTESMRWCDFKHYTVFDPQQYDITDNILTVEKGIVFKKTDSIPLYDLKEAKLSRSLLQRIFGLCTILLISREDSEKVILLENVWYDSGEAYRTIVSEIDRNFREVILLRLHRNSAFFECGYNNTR